MKTNSHRILPNLFSPTDFKTINSLVDAAIHGSDVHHNEDLGRLIIGGIGIPDTALNSLTSLVIKLTGLALSASPSVTAVEYSNKYGSPNLLPHFDRDQNEIIVDYQLISNTRWPLGINTSAYDLEDNSALMFNPNTNAHWRPSKIFKDEEYVRMIFFRFFLGSPKDYSDLPDHPNDPIFKDAREYREGFNLD